MISCVPFPVQQLIINNKQYTAPEWCTRHERVVILRVDACYDDEGFDMQQMVRVGDHFCRIFEHIYRHGGYISSFTGVSCVSVFSTELHGSVSVRDLAINATHVACTIRDNQLDHHGAGDKYKVDVTDFRCVIGYGTVCSTVVGGKPNWHWILLGEVLDEVDNCMNFAGDGQVMLTQAAADILTNAIVADTVGGFGVLVTNVVAAARVPLDLQYQKQKGPLTHSIRGQLVYWLDPTVANSVLSERSFGEQNTFETKQVIMGCVGLRVDLNKGWTLMAMHRFVSRVQEVVNRQKGLMLQCSYRESCLCIFILHDTLEVQMHKVSIHLSPIFFLKIIGLCLCLRLCLCYCFRCSVRRKMGPIILSLMSPLGLWHCPICIGILPCG